MFLGTKASSIPSVQAWLYGLWKQLLESVLAFLLSPKTKYSPSGTWKILPPFGKDLVFPEFVSLKYGSSNFVPVGFVSFVT